MSIYSIGQTVNECAECVIGSTLNPEIERILAEVSFDAVVRSSGKCRVSGCTVRVNGEAVRVTALANQHAAVALLDLFQSHGFTSLVGAGNTGVVLAMGSPK